MADFRRREFLKLLSSGAIALSGSRALGLSLAAARQDVSGPFAGEPLDVAVVGGGVSGVYTSWRLLTGDLGRSDALRPLAAGRRRPRLEVGLFEWSGRLGGRLHSAVPDGMPHLRAEMGGMRFLTNQAIVVKLVEHLGLDLKPFPVGSDENLYYLRGRRFRQRDWAQPNALSYALRAEDAGKSIDDLLVEVIEQYVPGARDLDQRAWTQVKATQTLDGQPLRDRSFWELLLRAKGAEVYRLIQDAGGYGSFYRNWNAAEMMSWIMADFLGSPTYLTLRGGYDGLPHTLARRFEDEGGHVVLRHRLRRLQRSGSLIELEFEDERGAAVRCQARHVVLALPKRSIELLARDSFVFDSPQFAADLQAVTPQAAGKVFLGYPRPWWEDLGLKAGRSTTDLPLRQCYYMGTEGDQPGADVANRNALLMASYHDDQTTGFWKALAGEGRADLRAPEALAAEAHRQVLELHGSPLRSAEPYLALYADWTRDPFGGSWHFWNVRTKPWEVIPRMRQPIPGAPLYVCGEAWSTDQGWVRGALQTAEKVLQEKFGLQRPAWLSANDYLGP